MGGDVGWKRSSADVMTLEAAGDRVDLSGGTAQLLISQANTTLGTADLDAANGAIVLRRQASGSPCLAFRLNGTVYGLFFAQAGGVVNGTPVT